MAIKKELKEKESKRHERNEPASARLKEYGSKTGGIKKKPTKKASTKVQKVMHEFKGKTLHSGKGGPIVKSRKQAIAIALSEASKVKKKK